MLNDNIIKLFSIKNFNKSVFLNSCIESNKTFVTENEKKQDFKKINI